MIAKNIAQELSGSSLIREMFEKGQRLSAEFGADQVFDFSLGNPDLPAPPEIKAALIAAAEQNDHAYMANAGYMALRELIAEQETAASAKAIQAGGVVMTVGAAGGLNVTLRALLDEGDEVILLTPYFPEYIPYVNHCGGKVIVVDCAPTDFMINFPALKEALNAKTKAIILNSPNNPCGRVYPAADLDQLNELLLQQDQSIYVLADEPYAEIVFNGHITPSPLRHFKNALRIYSWSKAYSLPGERIGYIAVSPDCADYERLTAALVYLNRSLGFVNAPAIWQQVILKVGKLNCPLEAYEARVDRLCAILNESGLACSKPEGSFYLFPKTLGADDKKFVDFLAEYHILAVPGTAFGAPGYMRLSSCVPWSTIEGSVEAFNQAISAWQKQNS